MSDVVSLAPLTPTSDGPLTTTITCNSVGRSKPGTRHPLTINADWSITTPHDLALERVATAMGGYNTCLDIERTTIPAIRDHLQFRGRRTPPPMCRHSGGRWYLSCSCSKSGYANPVEAGRHGREIEHVVRLHSAMSRLTSRITDECLATWESQLTPSLRHGRPLVREHDGLETLWDAGIHPEIVERLHGLLWPNGGPMPARFYLGAVMMRPDTGWLADTLKHVGDENVAVWLCWTESELDRTHPDARSAWLRAGVPRIAIIGLLNGKYTPQEVACLVARSGRTVRAAASTLAGWAAASCHPSVDDIVALDELDVDPLYAPSSHAIDWLEERLNTRSIKRTQLGLLLAIGGTRQGAVKLVRDGITDIHTLRRTGAAS